MEQHGDILFEIRESIAILTLCSPPGNYLKVPAFIPVSQFREWMGDEDLKGLIIRGEGRNFSAGGDLPHLFAAMDDDDGAIETLMSEGIELLGAIENLDIPVIAAINRVCFGGGLELALACHIRVASENALLAFPEVNMNLMPGMGGTMRLPAVTGLFRSAGMILGGDMLDATAAKEAGLIDHIAPRDQAFDYAWNLMVKMTRDRPVKVIRNIMSALENSLCLAPDEALKEESRLFCELARIESARRKQEDGDAVGS
ncbi:MAG: enoyl-CoA hydratase/isomerase family protein [Bacteroidota bacterium]